jgi:hypothetical protein
LKYKLLSVLILVSLLYISGCVSNVSIDYDETTLFSSYKTYQLIKPEYPEDLKDENPQVDNSLVRNRIETALNNELQTRGYQLSDEPDFYVTYFLQVKQEIESRNTGVSVGMGYGGWGRRGGIGMRYGFPEYDISTYDRGTLTIDILKSTDKSLVWRGSTSRRLDRIGTTPESNNKIVKEVVIEILSEFPPGTKK